MAPVFSLGRALRWWIGQWDKYPTELTTAWVSFFWFINLVGASEPVNIIHQNMHELMPLWCWGLVALGIQLMAILALDFPHLTKNRFARIEYNAVAAGWFLFVSGMFFVSGTSLTGWGTYLVLSWASLTKVLSLSNPRKGGDHGVGRP